MSLSIVAVSLIALLGCAGWLQQRLIFFPDHIDEQEDLSWTGGEEVFVEADDGARIHGLLFEADGDPRGVVLYFHGNAGSVASWYQVGHRLVDYGVDVFLVDYRTYGKSSGEMSEQGLYLDGEATYRYLVDDRAVDPERIVVHGRSLGSTVATHVAEQSPVAGVVLETPFTDLRALARDLYPFLPVPEWLVEFEFDNQTRSAGIDAPTWVVHGTEDEIVPPQHGEAIYESLAHGWELTMIDGGHHNNLMTFAAYRRDLQRFFNEVLGEEQHQERGTGQ